MKVTRLLLLATFLTTPAFAQSGDMANMPGMVMPGPAAPKAKTAKPTKSKRPAHHSASGAPSTSKAAGGMSGMAMPMDHDSGSPKSAAPASNTVPSGATMPGMDMKTMPGMNHAQAPASGGAPMPGMNMPMNQSDADHGSGGASGHAAMDHGMGNMDMGGMAGMSMNGALGSYPMTRDASGTSWQPDLAEHSGIHMSAGPWDLMAHAMLWGIYDTQSGPRGDDNGFAAGMLMGMARRNFGDDDTLSFRAMLSPDPFMGKSGYPLLLATGETANGTTHLVDRQHPHDLFMELSGTYSHKFDPDDSVFLYAGYPGEPALGPAAFMHRASGMDIPQAPITHHWLDSTHITFGVLTGGFVHDDWKLEVSQFTGREPDQYRYNFDPPTFDSTAVRASYNPDEHWSFQASWGFLKSPEQLDPTVNENRYTASATYITKFSEDSSLATTLGWGFKDQSDGKHLNGVFLEGEYKPAKGWTAFSRAEWEQNSEIDATGVTRPVGELTLGGIRDWLVTDHTKFGIGASYTFDFVSNAVTPSYGSDPHGAMVFARVTLE